MTETDRIPVRKKKALCNEVVIGVWHAVSNIKRGGNIMIAIEDSIKCNIPASRKRMKIVSRRI